MTDADVVPQGGAARQAGHSFAPAAEPLHAIGAG
jgi:hypothetical protein